ncbi:MAG TPA: permease-like cell division protein FtsX [Erysipelotrichaceae bacterium]|nr:permease-like cell division protein FtsX [Erysipelotrichaceae bacterium]
MIRKFFRHIREGFRNVFRNFAMSVSSISAVTITLILVGAFFIITTNVASISTSIKGSLTILVKIDRDTSENDITILKEKIENISEVKSVTYSSKHEELQKQIDLYPQQADYYRRHEGKDNPLYDVFIVEVDDATYLSAVNEQVANLKGIYSAEQGGDGVDKLVTYLNSMQSIGWILVGVLTFLAVYLIANTIKVTIYSRREEIGIMRTVGASNGFIRAPYLVGGIIIGGIGSIIPIILMGFGYNYLYNETGGILMSKIFVLQPVFPFVYQLSGILLALGVSVGFVGSFFSVTRYLRWKR